MTDRDQFNRLSFLLMFATLPLGCSDDGNGTGTDTSSSSTDASTSSASTTASTTESTTMTSDPTTTASTTETTATTQGDSSSAGDSTAGDSTAGDSTAGDSTAGDSSSGGATDPGSSSGTDPSTSGGSSGGMQSSYHCDGYAALVATCYPKYANYVDQIAGQCLDQVQMFVDADGPECGAALEDLLACVSTLDCDTWQSGDFCPTENTAALDACPSIMAMN